MDKNDKIFTRVYTPLMFKSKPDTCISDTSSVAEWLACRAFC